MRFLGPFNVADKTKFLEISYTVTIALLLSAVVFTPIFIRHHFLLFKNYLIQEDAMEAVLIIILLLIAYLLSNVYKRELKKYRQKTRRLSKDKSDLSNKLSDAFKYIGGVNVQIHEIQSIFCRFRRYPITENGFKKALALFGQTGLGIVNADWVLIRIIHLNNLRTIKDHFECRKNSKLSLKGISNKAIVANQAIDGYSIVASRMDNSMIMTVCVFPKKNLVQAITNQIEMLYLIFVSRQLHESYLNRKPIARIQKKLAT